MTSRLWFATLVPVLALAQSPGSVWKTWDVLEPDTCASVWLIKRYVDPGASFVFLPKGTPVDGRTFDTPDSKLRRYATASTYESVLREYRISDPVAIEIGTYIHEIEINPWARKSTSPSIEVENRVRDLTAKAANKEDLVTKVLSYFDQLDSELKTRSKPAGRR